MCNSHRHSHSYQSDIDGAPVICGDIAGHGEQVTYRKYKISKLKLSITY